MRESALTTLSLTTLSRCPSHRRGRTAQPREERAALVAPAEDARPPRAAPRLLKSDQGQLQALCRRQAARAVLAASNAPGQASKKPAGSNRRKHSVFHMMMASMPAGLFLLCMFGHLVVTSGYRRNCWRAGVFVPCPCPRVPFLISSSLFFLRASATCSSITW